jgi:hypothetical protein
MTTVAKWKKMATITILARCAKNQQKHLSKIL